MIQRHALGCLVALGSALSKRFEWLHIPADERLMTLSDGSLTMDRAAVKLQKRSQSWPIMLLESRRLAGLASAAILLAAGLLVPAAAQMGASRAGSRAGWTPPFAAATPEAADAWHSAGIANGGVNCEDPPGVRAGSNLYLAYLRDPSGNKICALHRMA